MARIKITESDLRNLVNQVLKETIQLKESYEVHYSDGVRAGKKVNDLNSAIQLAGKLINKPGMRFVDIYQSGNGFHSTADERYLVKWWGNGSYWDNMSKKNPELLDKKLNTKDILPHVLGFDQSDEIKKNMAIKKLSKSSTPDNNGRYEFTPKEVGKISSYLGETTDKDQKLKNYTLTVKHDNGKKKIKTTASSEAEAKKKIMNYEKCPESAIIDCKDSGYVLKEEVELNLIDDNFVGAINISFIEGSQQFDNEMHHNTTIREAQRYAKKKLYNQSRYRKTDETLWATFSTKVNGKWVEDFSKRIKLNSGLKEEIESPKIFVKNTPYSTSTITMTDMKANLVKKNVDGDTFTQEMKFKTDDGFNNYPKTLLKKGYKLQSSNTNLKEESNNTNMFKNYSIEEVIELAELAGLTVLDAEDALMDLTVAYGEEIPRSRVEEVLREYDMSVEELLGGRDEDGDYFQRVLFFAPDILQYVDPVKQLLNDNGISFEIYEDNGYDDGSLILEFPSIEEKEKASRLIGQEYRDSHGGSDEIEEL